MKKILATLVLIGLVTGGVTVLADSEISTGIGEQLLGGKQDITEKLVEKQNVLQPQEERSLLDDPDKADDPLSYVENQQMQKRFAHRKRSQGTENPRPLRRVNITGVWGYNQSDDVQGSITGILGHKKRTLFLKAEYSNHISGETGRVGGILKKGYFNGLIHLDDGSIIPITGLYKIDKEQKTLDIQWMTQQKDGWADIQLDQPKE